MLYSPRVSVAFLSSLAIGTRALSLAAPHAAAGCSRTPVLSMGLFPSEATAEPRNVRLARLLGALVGASEAEASSLLDSHTELLLEPFSAGSHVSGSVFRDGMTLDDKLAEYERSLAERISAASSEPVASALAAMRDHTIAAAARLRGGAVSRACAVRTATAAAAVMVRLPASAADPAMETRALLAEARRQLDPCQAQIADGSWDAVRTVVKTAPLASVPKLVTRYISEQGEAAEELVVPRQDFVQALQLLDMGVYNNNFVSEQNSPGARGKGVQVDRETPLRHLAEAKAALDEILAFSAAGGVP
mmetsp:Transcript_19648/g.61687  ORF Transcript_19648/g.61687 Transcript_19648/m.61687 type:complete len:305 (+) Transcript_19648:3-917(+)